MNFKTLIAKIVNYFKTEATHLSLKRLIAAVEADYAATVAKAETALHEEMIKVETAAVNELHVIERAVANAAKRAQGLLSLSAHDVLTQEEVDRVTKLSAGI